MMGDIFKKRKTKDLSQNLKQEDYHPGPEMELRCRRVSWLKTKGCWALGLDTQVLQGEGT